MNAIELLKQQHQEVEGFFHRARMDGGEERITLLGRIAEALTLHSALEELYFYPLMKDHGMEQEAEHSLKEHAEVKQLISRILQAKQTDPMLEQLMDQLITSVRQHVAEEEREIMPRLETIVDRGLLESTGAEMQQAISQLEQQNLLQMAERQELPVMQ